MVNLEHNVLVDKITREMLEVLVREIWISGKGSMVIVWNFKIDQ